MKESLVVLILSTMDLRITSVPPLLDMLGEQGDIERQHGLMRLLAQLNHKISIIEQSEYDRDQSIAKAMDYDEVSHWWRIEIEALFFAETHPDIFGESERLENLLKEGMAAW